MRRKEGLSLVSFCTKKGVKFSLVPFLILQGKGRKGRRAILLLSKVVGCGLNQSVREKCQRTE